eukprot:scaffold204209_cov31-Tisochrysis_lutea.AAC.1
MRVKCAIVACVRRAWASVGGLGRQGASAYSLYHLLFVLVLVEGCARSVRAVPASSVALPRLVLPPILCAYAHAVLYVFEHAGRRPLLSPARMPCPWGRALDFYRSTLINPD